MLVTCIISRVGQYHIYTVYIRYFWQGNYEIYGHIQCIYTVLANPNNIWLGGTGVCCTHAAIFLLQPAMGLHAHFYLYSLMINIIVTCIISVLVAQVFVAHTLQFPVATSNGFACTLLPVFFDVKHHSLPELAVPCSERQQHPAGSRRKGSILA